VIKKMKIDEKTEAEIKAVLEKSFEAYAKKDLDETMRLYAPDADLTVIGSGIDDKCVGLEQLREHFKRDFNYFESVNPTFKSVLVSTAGDIAWFASDISVQTKAHGKETSFPARLTGVLRRRDGNWLIVQSHLSIPASEQSVEGSFSEI